MWRSHWGGVHRSPVYLGWIKQAGLHIISQRPQLLLRTIPGPYSLIVRLKPRQPMPDLDNLCKGISDILQAHGLIENDKLCRKLLMIWDEKLDVECRVTIRAIGSNQGQLTPATSYAE